MKRNKTINLKHPDYQPSKAELEEPVKLNVPGKTTREKMGKLADAVLRPVNMIYKD